MLVSSGLSALRKMVPAHPVWKGFAVYYVATHVVTYWALFQYVPKMPTILSVWLGLQSLRFLPDSESKTFNQAASLAKDGVVELNKQALLFFFRLNFIWTLCLSIAIAASPFALASYLCGPLGVVSSLGLIAAVLHFRGESDKQLWKKRLPKKDCPKQPKRVCVIGGGAAGILTAKEMLEAGHQVDVLEKSASYGGVWSANTGCASACGSRVTGTTMSSSSIINSTFGDFQTMGNGSNPLHPTHFTEAQFRRYLHSYVEKHDIEKHIQVSTTVTKVVKRPDGTYEVTYQTDGETKTSIYDVCCVCTGLNQETRAASTKMAGKASHTSEANNAESYKDKTVVLVGIGESSTDLAADVANEAKHVHIIVRSPTMLLPRNTFGTNIAPDHKLSRALLHCPQYLRTLKLMAQTCVFGPFDWVARNLLGVTSFGVDHDAKPEGAAYEDNWCWEWWYLFHKLSTFHPNAKGYWALTSGQVTKTAPLIEQYRQGKITFHTTDIVKTEEVDGGLKLTLGNGESLDCDAMVNATGYTTTFPFLAEEGLEHHKIQERYRLVYHPDHPNMPFIGLARAGVGSIFFGTEMQARWAALIASGERVLPSALEMKVMAKEHAAQQAGKWPSKITMVFSNAIARNEIGCEPDLYEVFWNSPKAWFYLMFGPYCVSQYRFRGPAANPEYAEGVFKRGPVLVYPLEFPLQQGLELTFGFLSRFYGSLLGDWGKKFFAVRKFVTPFIDLNN